jgi:hypothetical protein
MGLEKTWKKLAKKSRTKRTNTRLSQLLPDQVRSTLSKIMPNHQQVLGYPNPAVLAAQA